MKTKIRFPQEQLTKGKLCLFMAVEVHYQQTKEDDYMIKRSLRLFSQPKISVSAKISRSIAVFTKALLNTSNQNHIFLHTTHRSFNSYYPPKYSKLDLTDGLLVICRTAGQKSVFGKSCNRPPRYRFFFWSPYVYKQMLRCFSRFHVATTCFQCSPPDLNLLVTNFISFLHVK